MKESVRHAWTVQSYHRRTFHQHRSLNADRNTLSLAPLSMSHRPIARDARADRQGIFIGRPVNTLCTHLLRVAADEPHRVIAGESPDGLGEILLATPHQTTHAQVTKISRIWYQLRKNKPSTETFAFSHFTANCNHQIVRQRRSNPTSPLPPCSLPVRTQHNTRF